MSEEGWAGMGELTKTGWPRPIIDGLPIPWISPHDSLSTVNPARYAACSSGAVCAVCGEGYEGADNPEDQVAYAFVRKETINAPLEEGTIYPMDNGIMHARCAKLALKVCPKLRSLVEAGNLAIIATAGNIAEPEMKDGKGLVAALDGKYCKVVEEIP